MNHPKLRQVLECASPLCSLHASLKPEGIVSSSPGLRGTSYPGVRAKKYSTLKGLWLGGPRVSGRVNPKATILSGLEASPPLTQGSSFLATLGFGAESLWDSPEDPCKVQSPLALFPRVYSPNARLKRKGGSP